MLRIIPAVFFSCASSVAAGIIEDSNGRIPGLQIAVAKEDVVGPSDSDGLANADNKVAAEASYFILDGNPVAVKYASGKLQRLPTQDAYDSESLQGLEAVSALMRHSHLLGLSPSGVPHEVRISPPRMTGYGVAMFATDGAGPAAPRDRAPAMAWTGPASFREVVLDQPGVGARLKRSLAVDAQRLLTTKLDFRAYKPVGRRLKLDGPVSLRDHGRSATAPHLAFVDLTWAIKDLPEALANNGTDALSPFFRVEYVVDTRKDRVVYRNIINAGGAQDRAMRLFKEEGGPLLMAVMLNCSDGAEPLIIDLDNETYGIGRPGDVPEVSHCFSAQ